jgi:predicted neuraminidase
MIESLRRREQRKEVQAFLNELDFLRIMTVDNPRNAAAFHETAVSLLRKNNDFEDLLSMEEGKQRVLIVALTPQNNRTTEVVMISYINNASLTVVNITGNIDISDLSQLATIIRNLR